MMLGLVGKKCGMTRLFLESGESVPVTVIAVQPNRVVQVKTRDKEGYDAIQVTTGTKKISRLTKPLARHFANAEVGPGDCLVEFRLSEAQLENFAVGRELGVEFFQEGQWVDVTGVTKGKGFAGVIKRHHFAGGPATHGNSLSHRVPGSIGQRQTPGRVFKGKKMAGHLGDVQRTIQNQQIVKVDGDRNLVLIRGAVPGAPGGYVIVRPAVKKGGQEGGN